MTIVLLILILILTLNANCAIDAEEESDRIKKQYINNQLNYPNHFDLFLPRWQQSMNNTLHRHTDYDFNALKEHRSTKELFIVANATLADMTMQRNKQMLEEAIIKEMSTGDYIKYSKSKVIYAYPNRRSLNYSIPKLINTTSISHIKEYNEIRETIAINPNGSISFNSKPICIPTMRLLNITNHSKQRVVILGVKSDLYQLNIFILNKDYNSNNDNDGIAQYFNPKITYPRELQRDRRITFQLIALPDTIGEVKGYAYLDIIIDKTPSVIVIPITIEGIDNIYQVRPFYYPQWQTEKLLSMPLKIYNPYSNSTLIIQEAVNSFTSINLLWSNGEEVESNGSSNPIELQPQAKKIIMFMNYYKESPGGVEYGLLQLKTNKDTLIIPVLVKASPMYLRPYPAYFNFGLIDGATAASSTVQRVIPLQLANLSNEPLIVNGVYMKYDDTAIEFVINKECGDMDMGISKCVIKPGEHFEVGYVVLNPIQALLSEGEGEMKDYSNKIVNGKLYIESSSTSISTSESQFSEIDYEYTISTSNIDNDDNRAMIPDDGIDISIDDFKDNETNIVITKPFIDHLGDHHINNKNLNRELCLNDGIIRYEFIHSDNWVDIRFTIQNKEEFIKGNTYAYYIPFYINDNSYSVIPVQISDNMIDLVYCDEEINLEKCQRKGRYALYKGINSISQYQQRRIEVDIGDILNNKEYFKYIVLINNNNNPMLVILVPPNEKSQISINMLSKDNKVLDLPDIITIAPQSSIKFRICIRSMNEASLFKDNKEIRIEFPYGKISTSVLIKGSILQELSMNFNDNSTIHSQSNSTNIKKLNVFNMKFSNDKGLTYREVYLWKAISNSLLSPGLEINTNTHIEDHSISSPSIDYGHVQLGKTHQAYITITNPFTSPILIQPFLSSDLIIDTIDLLSVRRKQYKDINDIISLFNCFFQGQDSIEFEKILYDIHKKKPEKITRRDLLEGLNSIILNQDLTGVLNNDAMNKDKLIELLFTHAQSLIQNSFKTSKRVLCKVRMISKEEVLSGKNEGLQKLVFSRDLNREIDSIKSLSNKTLYDYLKSHNASLDTYAKTKDKSKPNFIQVLIRLFRGNRDNADSIRANTNHSSNMNQQEVFLASKEITLIQPNETITIGPILYHPLQVGILNMTLLIKNNLTIITPIEIKGSSGIGIARFQTNEVNPIEITSNYSIIITKQANITQLNGKILKQILLTNIGNLPLHYPHISLNNNQCEINGISLLTCNPIYLEASQSKLIEFSIEVNFDFISQSQSLILQSSNGDINEIIIEVTIDNELLRLHNDHFFTLSLSKESLLTVMIILLMGIVMYLAAYWNGKRKKKGKGKTEEDNADSRTLNIISNVIISNQSDSIQLQNLYMKSYRKYDNAFYEDVIVKMNEEKARHEEVEDIDVKKKRKHISNINNKQAQHLKKKRKPKVIKPIVNIISKVNEIDLNEENKLKQDLKKTSNDNGNNRDNSNKPNSKSEHEHPFLMQNEVIQIKDNQTLLQERERDQQELTKDIKDNQSHTLIEQFNGNPLYSFQSPTTPNKGEVDEDTSEDLFNDLNFQLSNIFTNDNKFNYISEEDNNNKPIDSGTEEMRLCLNSIFGSNMRINMNFNDKPIDNKEKANEALKKEENQGDTTKPYFKALDNLIRNEYDPFTLKEAYILTDLLESDEESIKHQEKPMYNDKEEEDPEWDIGLIDNKAEGYFDKTGTYRIK